MGDLGEVILSHGSLLDGEGTVVRRHNVQGVAAAAEQRATAEEGLEAATLYNVKMKQEVPLPHLPSRLIR